MMCKWPKTHHKTHSH